VRPGSRAAAVAAAPGCGRDTRMAASMRCSPVVTRDGVGVRSHRRGKIAGGITAEELPRNGCERAHDLVGPGRALVGILGQHASDQRDQIGRVSGRLRATSTESSRQILAMMRWASRRQRAAAGETFEEHAAQANVGASVDSARPRACSGAMYRGVPSRAGAGDAQVLAWIEKAARDAEVNTLAWLGSPPGRKTLAGLMSRWMTPCRVRHGQGLGHAATELQGLGDAQRPARHAVLQGLALQPLHHQVLLAAGGRAVAR